MEGIIIHCPSLNLVLSDNRLILETDNIFQVSPVSEKEVEKS
jgi:hypothetical protein